MNESQTPTSLVQTLSSLAKPGQAVASQRHMAKLERLRQLVNAGYAVEHDVDGSSRLRLREPGEPPQPVHAQTREKQRRLRQLERQRARAEIRS